ncbi:metal ABC transporter solute-binding protein, Zn/Mn family [Paenibacillus sp. GCM10027627]|uniref:metal ABC transporter solute-binding protein, Zn/Mn family n=1 Tax=unclassified Paenibacillus TaxID=185978 RepID=UPI003637C747
MNILKHRKFRTAGIAATLALMLLASGCGGDDNAGGSTPAPTESAVTEDKTEKGVTAQKLRVVTSFYPLYYLASEIGGDYVSVDNLIAAGVEPHDWTPKSKDLSVASNAKLLLYHGAGLELWVDQFRKGLSKESNVVMKEMSAGVSLMTGEAESHQHEHHGDESGDHHNVDPHTWVSPKSALILADNVRLSLVEADAANAEHYEKNYKALKDKLIALDEAYTYELAAVKQKNMVVSHQAFGYLARDYGLNQVSIMGLSPDAEPRAQDIMKIAKFVKDNEVRYIFFEELVSDQLAKMLANEADVQTMVLNPLEGLTKEQQKAGETYLSLMERNLKNLITALQ